MQAEKRIGCYTVDVFSSTSDQVLDRLSTLKTVEPSIALLQGPVHLPSTIQPSRVADTSNGS